MSPSLSRKGLLYGVLAFGLWGLLPPYWKLLSSVDPLELLAHRAVWSLGAFAGLTLAAGQIGALRAALRNRRLIGVMAVSGTLIAIHWSMFVWATVSGHLLDASFGYFITPLLSVALGTIVLRERLRRLQWVAIGFAFAGVALLTWYAGRVPWVALVVGGTFGAYGLVRKIAKVDALVGSSIETLLMVPIAAIYLTVLAARGGGALGHESTTTVMALMGTGLVTAIPFVLFTSAARLLPLSTLGFLQYLAPTGQFFLAVLAFGEPLAHDRLAAFVLIWIGFAVFSADLLRAPERV